MPAEDRFLLFAGLRGIHAVDPPRPSPFLRLSLPPVGPIAVTAAELPRTGDPAVDENVAPGLVIVDRGRDDLPEIRRAPRCRCTPGS